MQTRKLALLAALAIAGGAAATFTPPASAQVSFSLSVGTPPPPMRYEVVPAPRPGYVWAPGYWNWSGSQYVWIGGNWRRDRPGYVYYQPRWERDGDQYVAVNSGWGGAVPLWGGAVADIVKNFNQGGMLWVFKLGKASRPST